MDLALKARPTCDNLLQLVASCGKLWQPVASLCRFYDTPLKTNPGLFGWDPKVLEAGVLETWRVDLEAWSCNLTRSTLWRGRQLQ